MFWFKRSNRIGQRGQPRRRVKSLWRHPVFVMGFILFFVGSISFYGWRLWHSDFLSLTVDRAKTSFIINSAKKGFVVRKILVNGRVETSRGDLIRALNLKGGSPILMFNAKKARIRIEALPWIQKAIIERQLPDVIHISLIERRPLALWQRNGVFSLIDERGDLIPLDNVSAYSNLIVIIGKDAPAKAGNLFKVLLSKPQLARRVTAAVRVGGRRWNLHLNGKTEVLLPENGADAAWVHLATLYKNYDELFSNLKTIDLRLVDRVVIRQADNDIVIKGLDKEPLKGRFKSMEETYQKFKRELNSNIGDISIKGNET